MTATHNCFVSTNGYPFCLPLPCSVEGFRANWQLSPVNANAHKLIRKVGKEVFSWNTVASSSLEAPLLLGALVACVPFIK